MQTPLGHSFQGTCCEVGLARWVRLPNLCGILTHCPNPDTGRAVELTAKPNRI